MSFYAYRFLRPSWARKTRFTAGLLTSDSCYPEEQLINRGRGALQEWPVSHLPPVTVDKDVKNVDPCTLVVEMENDAATLLFSLFYYYF